MLVNLEIVTGQLVKKVQSPSTAGCDSANAAKTLACFIIQMVGYRRGSRTEAPSLDWRDPKG